jgi:hypothetical protein
MARFFSFVPSFLAVVSCQSPEPEPALDRQSTSALALAPIAQAPAWTTSAPAAPTSQPAMVTHTLRVIHPAIVVESAADSSWKPIVAMASIEGRTADVLHVALPQADDEAASLPRHGGPRALSFAGTRSHVRSPRGGN